MLKHIQLSKIEAEVVEHRLQFLADASDEDLCELFEGEGLRIDYLRDFASVTSRNLREGLLMIPLSSDEAVAALADAIEGATIQDMAVEAEQEGAITKQKVAAYLRALSSAARKLGVMGEREVVAP